LQIIPFLPKFRERHPNIEIQLKRFNKNPLEKALHNHRVDLACLLFNIEQINSSIKYKIIDERHLAIILNKKHPYSHRKTLSLPELENELFILLGHPNTSAEYHTVIDWCIRCGFQPRIIDSFDYVEVLLMQIENSNYITILSDNSPYIHYNNLSCIPLENAPILYDGFLWNDNNDNTINDNINLFINQYQNYLQEISFYKK
jgi:DNA-binding transcriptional LysR family regulator